MEYRLSDLAEYSMLKIETSKLTIDNYISTENMLPNNGGIVQATNLPHQENVGYVEKENILLSNIRPYFKKIWFSKFIGGCSNDVLNIKVKDRNKIFPKYLYYNLLQNDFFDYVMSATKGTKMPRGDKNHIMNYVIKVPNLSIQNKAVTLLDNIDKKIELNNHINENLLDLGDTLYKEYFQKEELPNEWNICKLKDVAYNFDSKRKPMSSLERTKHKGIYPYYGATSIIDYVDDYIFDGVYLLMGEDGTVVTSEGNPVLQYIWGENWINNHAHVLKGNTISTEHLMFALRNCNVRDIITGAVQPKINQENMNNIKIILADEKTNIEFEKIIEPLMKKYRNNIEKNRILKKIRDTLLPKLMNEEINIDKIKI